MKGKYLQDWHRVDRFVVPLPAVPTCDRKQRLAQDRDFYAALLMCYAPHERPDDLLLTWRMRDECYRRCEQDAGGDR